VAWSSADADAAGVESTTEWRLAPRANEVY
jgi:hypothetical protein